MVLIMDKQIVMIHQKFSFRHVMGASAKADEQMIYEIIEFYVGKYG